MISITIPKPVKISSVKEGGKKTKRKKSKGTKRKRSKSKRKRSKSKKAPACPNCVFNPYGW
jgi:hypothetical protein